MDGWGKVRCGDGIIALHRCSQLLYDIALAKVCIISWEKKRKEESRYCTCSKGHIR